MFWGKKLKKKSVDTPNGPTIMIEFRLARLIGRTLIMTLMLSFAFLTVLVVVQNVFDIGTNDNIIQFLNAMGVGFITAIGFGVKEFFSAQDHDPPQYPQVGSGGYLPPSPAPNDMGSTGGYGPIDSPPPVTHDDSDGWGRAPVYHENPVTVGPGPGIKQWQAVRRPPSSHSGDAWA